MIKYKSLQYFFIQLVLTLVTCTQLQRHVQEEDDEDRNSQDYDDDDNTDDKNDILQTIYDAEARIEQDLGNMWASSPSAWVAEYWEVFSGMLFITCFILFRLCYIPSPAERENTALLQHMRQQRAEIRELKTKQEESAANAANSEEAVEDVQQLTLEKEALMKQIEQQEMVINDLKGQLFKDSDTVTLATIGESTVGYSNKPTFRGKMERTVDKISDKMGSLIESWSRHMDNIVDPCSDHLFGPVDNRDLIRGSGRKSSRHRQGNVRYSSSRSKRRSQLEEEEGTPYMVHSDSQSGVV